MLILGDEAVYRDLNILDKNIKTTYLKRGRIFHPRNIINLIKILKTIKKFDPDALDFRSGYPWDCLCLFFLSKYPIIVPFHTAKARDGEKEQFLYKIGKNLLLKYADRIITFGQAAKEIMIDEYNISPENIHVLAFGNYAEAYTRTPLKNYNKSKNQILFFGRIVDFKGLEYLINAEPYITKEVPDAKIVIAGPCDNFSIYEKMIENRNSFLIYNQWISGEMITEMFRNSDVVVLPYTQYSESHNIQLAYAFKKPIVSTNVGSISEYIENGKTGILVPPRDPKKLALAIIRVLKDKRLSKKIGEGGRKKLDRDFSWDGLVSAHLDIYKISKEAPI